MAERGRVVVIGSINMDVVVTVPRMPLPGETLAGGSVHQVPGGKGANQAVAARRLGVPTVLVGAVGADGFGTVLAGFLGAERIDISPVRTEHGPTGTALITVADGGENTVIVVAGANGSVGPNRVAEAALRSGDVVLLQDEIPAETNEAAAAAARAAGATTILNLAPFRPPSRRLLDAVDVLIVNETEFAELVGASGAGADGIAELLRSGDALTAPDGGPLGDVVVTLGVDGALARIGGELLTVPGRRMPVVDTTGAGDCFCGTFGASLAVGLEPASALARANTAAGLAVGRFGAGPSMPTADEVAAVGPA
ncbi:ribokinase [Frankia nepalensis]|uniref:Ribokinase n=1 Tax=Frankia nepalensis TaxID=1836974 RepID=A0A937UQQ7_9ACTN|nr:ribokinase [Frankia nepalensis]MBL7502003.1 ribokinase [Frankia nepalensis]MBL7516344.1 ribokinase [Frankia nepalensis]MBL7632084.1 ribokinase [Frankia nepalensis]